MTEPVATERNEYTLGWWYHLGVLVFAATLVVLISVVLDVGVGSLVAMPVVIPLVLRSVLRTTLTPTGVQVGTRTAAWGDLEVRSTQFGDAIATRKSTPFSKRLAFSPVAYEWHWRSGRIGQDLRRWAPHLLDKLKPKER